MTGFARAVCIARGDDRGHAARVQGMALDAAVVDVAVVVDARQAARNRLDAQTMQTIDDLEWHDRKSVLAGRYAGVQAWGSLAQNV